MIVDPHTTVQLGGSMPGSGFHTQALHTRVSPGEWSGREDDGQHSEADACFPVRREGYQSYIERTEKLALKNIQIIH